MERLKDDIDLKAEKFGHIEYYDAKLRDGYSNEVAVAANEIHNLDERRKSLANVNPLFAKASELPPQPNIENITFEHLSLNLPIIAKNALDELDQIFDQTGANNQNDLFTTKDEEKTSNRPADSDDMVDRMSPEQEMEQTETMDEKEERRHKQIQKLTIWKS